MAKKRRQEPEPKAEEEEDGENETNEEHQADSGEGSDQEDEDMNEALSSEEEDEGDAAVPADPTPLAAIKSSITSDGRYHNKQRMLLISSRGITARYRHLLEDLRTLIPHSKKESKLDVGKSDHLLQPLHICSISMLIISNVSTFLVTGKNYSGSGSGAGGGYGAAVNEIAEVRGCHTVLFLETRKRGQDGYLWLGRTSHANSSSIPDNDSPENVPKKHLMITGGPSIKFHITNIHTMDELKMTGNCMKGSRPVLSFDKAFDEVDHLKMVKHLFVDVFGTPRGHPKSKPFVDRVMGFYYADGKVRSIIGFCLPCLFCI